MTKKESQSVYEDIDMWDRFSVNGCWKDMRERKLEEFKKNMNNQYLGDKIGS